MSEHKITLLALSLLYVAQPGLSSINCKVVCRLKRDFGRVKITEEDSRSTDGRQLAGMEILKNEEMCTCCDQINRACVDSREAKPEVD